MAASSSASTKQDMLTSLLEDGLPEDMAAAVASFAEGVNDIEERVRRLQSVPWAELCRGLPPLESARLHLMVAYTVNTLFYMYLKTQGITATNHPVMAELERVKTYIRKVKDVTKATQATVEASERQVSLNASAAQRFIAHALGGGADKPAGAAAKRGAEGGARAEAGGVEEYDSGFSQGVVERMDRERAATVSSELGTRLERMGQQAGETQTGDAEHDNLAREINAEVNILYICMDRDRDGYLY